MSGNLGEDAGTGQAYWRPLIMWVETFWSIDLSGIALKILHNIQGEASFRLTAFFRFTCVKGLLHNIQIPNSNRSVMKDIVHRSMSIEGFLDRLSDRSRIKTRQP